MEPLDLATRMHRITKQSEQHTDYIDTIAKRDNRITELEQLLRDAQSRSQRSESLQSTITTIIRQTLDRPTYIDPLVNCRNLTKALQEIERTLATPAPAQAST